MVLIGSQHFHRFIKHTTVLQSATLPINRSTNDQFSLASFNTELIILFLSDVKETQSTAHDYHTGTDRVLELQIALFDNPSFDLDYIYNSSFKTFQDTIMVSYVIFLPHNILHEKFYLLKKELQILSLYILSYSLH